LGLPWRRATRRDPACPLELSGGLEGLIAELARDHRVVVYDPRGCGQSTAAGPFDLRTDCEDLAAVVEAAGGNAVALAVANGLAYAVHAAAEHPDLISHVVAFGPAAAVVLPRAEAEGAGMLASSSVIEMLQTMQATDPRAASRAIISATNPQLDEDELQERVERLGSYLSSEATIERSQAWLEDDASEQMLALGERFWILYGGGDGLYEESLTEQVAGRFPEAHMVEIADGPISRPDAIAETLRRLTLRSPR